MTDVTWRLTEVCFWHRRYIRTLLKRPFKKWSENVICASSLILHEAEVQVKTKWTRLELDVTHYRGRIYLSMIDCGPGQMAIWREIRTETAAVITERLNDIFWERGPLEKVLINNSTAFRSECLQEMLRKWSIRRYFRAAYRSSGNYIIERHQSTIKAIA